jgi:hypothetical protein
MGRDLRCVVVLLSASIITGAIGWSGHVLLLPVATLFPIIWSLTKTRWQAAVVSAGYFLAASRGLPQGVAAFYASDIWPGLLLWLVASSSFVTVHVLFWTKNTGWRKAACYSVACIAMAVPPFGILGWAHPLTAAGVVFPGWGWLGLALMATSLAVLTTWLRPAAAIAILGFWIWSAVYWTDPAPPVAWQGRDLHLGASLGRGVGLEHLRDLIFLARQQSAHTTLVLPESALGFWTPTVNVLWQRELAGSHVTVVAGAAVINGNGYDNVLVRVSEFGSTVLYRERMPVPGSMWQPWRIWIGQSGGARAYVFANPTIGIAGAKVAPLICYEQLILWPVLQSMIYDPDIILAVGNGWWATDTSIVAIQRASVTAWARLFAKPLVISFNT